MAADACTETQHVSKAEGATAVRQGRNATIVTTRRIPSYLRILQPHAAVCVRRQSAEAGGKSVSAVSPIPCR